MPSIERGRREHASKVVRREHVAAAVRVDAPATAPSAPSAVLGDRTALAPAAPSIGGLIAAARAVQSRVEELVRREVSSSGAWSAEAVELTAAISAIAIAIDADAKRSEADRLELAAMRAKLEALAPIVAEGFVRASIAERLELESANATAAREAQRVLDRSKSAIEEASDGAIEELVEEHSAAIAELDARIEALDRVIDRLHATLDACRGRDDLHARLELTRAEVLIGSVLEQRAAIESLRDDLARSAAVLENRRAILTAALDAELIQLGRPPSGRSDARGLQRTVEALAEAYGFEAPSLPAAESFGETARAISEFLAQVRAQRAGNELLARKLLSSVFGIDKVQGSPLEVLARAAGLTRLDADSLRALSVLARGEEDSPLVERGPIINALARIQLKRRSLTSAELVALQARFASRPLTRKSLDALAIDLAMPLELRETARKLGRTYELSKALFGQGVDPPAALAELTARASRLEQVGLDGPVSIEAFYVEAAAEAGELSAMLARGDTEAALRLFERLTRAKRMWLVHEYEAMFGEGSLARDAERGLGPAHAQVLAEALLRDEHARGALIAGQIEEGEDRIFRMNLDRVD